MTEPNSNTNTQHAQPTLASKMKKLIEDNPNITDTEMESHFNNMMNDKRKQSHKKVDCDDNKKCHLSVFSPFSHLFDFTQRVNSMWKQMDDEFSKFNDFDDDHEQLNEEQSYPQNMTSFSRQYKSMTHRDETGKVTTKATYRADDVKDGKRTTSKKILTRDENGTIVEEILPNGERKIINNQKTLKQ